MTYAKIQDLPLQSQIVLLEAYQHSFRGDRGKEILTDLARFCVQIASLNQAEKPSFIAPDAVVCSSSAYDAYLEGKYAGATELYEHILAMLMEDLKPLLTACDISSAEICTAAQLELVGT